MALEFSTLHRNAALVNAVEGNEPRLLGYAEDLASKTVSPMALVERCMKEAGLRPEEVNAIAVGLGPGSYTGVRSGIAIAEGWEIGRKIAVIGVGAMDCLCAQAQEQGIHGVLQIVIDAQRNELYSATYRVTASERALLQAVHIVPMAGFRPEPGAILVGPEVNRWSEEGRLLAPDSRTLAKLAASAEPKQCAAALEPIYLREVSFVKAPPPRRVE